MWSEPARGWQRTWHLGGRSDVRLDEGDGQMLRVGEHGDWLNGSQTPPLNDLPTNFLLLLGLVSSVVRAWPWAMPEA